MSTANKKRARITTHSLGRNKTQQLAENLQTSLSQRHLPVGHVLESIFQGTSDGQPVTDLQAQQDLNAALDGAKTALTGALETSGDNIANYDENQVMAATQAAVKAGDLEQYAQQQQAEYASIEQGTVMPASDFSQHPALEAFSQQDLTKVQTYSMVYNLSAARQDPFGEAFFPMLTHNALDRTVVVECTMLAVLNTVNHQLNGKLEYQMGKANIMKALRYPGILNQTSTMLYPVFRRGENEDYFAPEAEIAPVSITHDETTFETSWLKVGVTIESFLGLTSHNNEIANGLRDRTYVLDSKFQLGALCLKFGNDLISFTNLDLNGGMDFMPIQEGSKRRLVMNKEIRSMILTPETKDIKNNDLATLSAIKTNNLRVLLQFNFSGDVDVETSRVNTSATQITVHRIYNDSNEMLSLTEGIGKDIADLIKAGTVAYFKPISRLLNDNLRKRGQELEMDTVQIPYRIPTLSPISARRTSSVVGQPAPDAGKLLEELANATYIDMSRSAVTELLRMEAYLQTLPDVVDRTQLYENNNLGAARFYIDKWYKHDTIDMNDVMTLKEHERMTDMSARIVTTLRKQVFDAYTESNYGAVHHLRYGNNKVKPTVIIGGDPRLIGYIQVPGDLRTLSENFNVELVSTPNIDMTGRLIWVFGKAEGASNDLSNPLHFANTIWCPEIVVDLDPAQNKDIVYRTMLVAPSWQRIIHTPVMGGITVENLNESMDTYVPVRTKVTP